MQHTLLQLQHDCAGSCTCDCMSHLFKRITVSLGNKYFKQVIIGGALCSRDVRHVPGHRVWPCQCVAYLSEQRPGGLNTLNLQDA